MSQKSVCAHPEKQEASLKQSRYAWLRPSAEGSPSAAPTESSGIDMRKAPRAEWGSPSVAKAKAEPKTLKNAKTHNFQTTKRYCNLQKQRLINFLVALTPLERLAHGTTL